MKSSEAPYLADWFAISLRWLSLMGFSTGLALSTGLTLETGAALLFGSLWNVFITVLALQNRRLPYQRPLNLLADVAIGLFVFQNNGGVQGILPWASVLPLFTASIYYELRGGLLASVVIAAAELGLAYLYQGQEFALSVLGGIAGFNLLVGLAFGGASRMLMNQIRHIYQNTLQVRQSAERKAALIERNRLQTFIRMVETISSTLNYRLVLDAVLDLCAGALGLDEQHRSDLVCVVLLFADHDLRIEAARGLSAHDLRETFPAEAGLLHKSLESAEVSLGENPAADPELGRIMVMQTCKTALVVPLRRGVNAYGMLLFGHPEAGFFNPERVELLEMIGHQAVISIQNARLYQDLESEKERIVQSQEEARKKLARDLHDGPIQSVAAIAMRADVARHMLSRSTQEANNELTKIEEVARRTTKELRHMLFTLRPLALETEGLEVALKTMAEKTRETYQQNVQVDVEATVVDQLELNKQTVVFYLAEEAVNNARKHAQAPVIYVRLRRIPQEPTIALLEILDSGRGFDVQEVMGSYDKRGSLGMVNLQERTDLISGLLQIDSAPGKGTRIRVFIPLTEEAADRLQRGKLGK